MRSRSAAALLAGAGFPDVASLEGGIQAWNGLVAAGPPEAGMAYFAGSVRPPELMALAWYLEAGSRSFYAALAGTVGESDAVALYERLAGAEERHMERLRELSVRLAGPRLSTDFPQGVLPQQPPDAVMEGGIEVAKAVAWSRGKAPADLLEYCISLEAGSYDLYLRMVAATGDAEARGVFELLAAEEQRHLEWLAAGFERQAAAGAAEGASA